MVFEIHDVAVLFEKHCCIFRFGVFNYGYLIDTIEAVNNL